MRRNRMERFAKCYQEYLEHLYQIQTARDAFNKAIGDYCDWQGDRLYADTIMSYEPKDAFYEASGYPGELFQGKKVVKTLRGYTVCDTF